MAKLFIIVSSVDQLLNWYVKIVVMLVVLLNCLHDLLTRSILQKLKYMHPSRHGANNDWKWSQSCSTKYIHLLELVNISPSKSSTAELKHRSAK